MVSPMPEIMEDVKKHDGAHRNAVERLLKKWFISTVSSTSTITSTKHVTSHLFVVSGGI